VHNGDVRAQGGTCLTCLATEDEDLVAQDHRWGNLGMSAQGVD
jgi:hypothetical protein